MQGASRDVQNDAAIAFVKLVRKLARRKRL